MTKAKDNTEYQSYIVAFSEGGRTVHILDDKQDAEPGFRKVGEFEANAVEGKIKGEDDFDTRGDHILVAKARAVLEDLGITDVNSLTFEDKASQSTAETGTYVGTVEETVRANASDDEGNAADHQKEVSDNLDKAEKKVDKDK